MSKGSGVGVLLISPRGNEIRVAVQLNFKTSNNEAEYEALLTDLWSTKHIRAVKVIIHLDSQLTAR